MIKSILALVAAAALVSAAGCAGKTKAVEKEVAEGAAAVVYAQESNTARYNDEKVVIEISYLSNEMLDTYFERFRGGMYKNPYLPKSFTVFSVSVRNVGDGNVEFDPRLTLLMVKGESPSSARDFTELYTTLTLAQASDVDERMTAYKESGYDITEAIPPGGFVQKLLVFGRSEGPKAGGMFMFNGLYVEGATHSVTMPFASPF